MADLNTWFNQENLRTAIYTVGACVALMQLRLNFKLNRLKVLSSFNDRLSRCSKANAWIWNSGKEWGELSSDEQYEFQK